jgi:hypothetical protein
MTYYTSTADTYNFGVTALLPSAEDLAASSSGNVFGVSYNTGMSQPSTSGEAFGVSAGGSGYLDAFNAANTAPDESQNWPEIAPESVAISAAKASPLTDPKNKPLLIGAGVLLVLGAVYMVSTKKAKGGK